MGLLCDPIQNSIDEAPTLAARVSRSERLHLDDDDFTDYLSEATWGLMGSSVATTRVDVSTCTYP